MWKKQERLLAEAVVGADEESSGGVGRVESKEEPLKEVPAVETTLGGATPREVVKEDVAESQVQAGNLL